MNKNDSDNLIKSLLNEMSNPKDLNKKQISVFLKPDILEELDTLIKDLNNYTERSMSRNYLIELAIKNLIECYPTVKAKYKEKYNPQKSNFDTVVYPSDCDGLKTLKEENKWYYVRINQEYIPKIKYLALYLGHPTSQITHYATVNDYEPLVVDGKVKYIVHIKDIKKLTNPIVLGDTNPLGTRSPKYTTLEKLKKAKQYSDLN